MKRVTHILIWGLLLVCQVTQAKQTLSLTDFFQRPSLVMAKVSPKGQHIARVEFHDQKQRLSVQNITTDKVTELVDIEQLSDNDKASLQRVVWLDEQHIAVQLVESKKGIEDLLDTKTVRKLLIVKLPQQNQAPIIYSVRTKGWLVNPLSKQAGTFLYAKSGIYSKVYKIAINKLAPYKKRLGKLDRIDGGQFKKSSQVADVTGYATRWFFSAEGEVQSVLHFTREQALQLSSYDQDGDKQALKTWSKAELASGDSLCLPIAMANVAKQFYCLALKDQNERSLYQVDYQSGEKRVVYQSKAYRIVDLVLTKQQQLIGVKVLNNGQIETEFVGQDAAELANNKPTAPELKVEINQSADQQFTVQYRERHNNPGAFYLLQNNQSSRQASTKLIGFRFNSLQDKLASEQVVNNVVVEGLEIPYILSIPTDGEKVKPLVVMPHGGPIGVFDGRYYDATRQAIVNAGYAVLQVNFRGSSGYSEAFKEAGKKQWGKLMLTDIDQAVQSVVKRPDISPGKVCLFGMSYGGYAATMLAIKYPERYQCAANWAGVSDLNLYVNSTSLTAKQLEWSREYIGDSTEEYDELNDISTVYQAKNLQRPLLIGHGSKDKVVDIEHAYRLKLMLDKHNINYQWYLDQQANHSFGDDQRTIAFFDVLLAFLAQHLKPQT